MTPLFAAAGEVQAFLQQKGWRYCFIGGVALQAWGEMRLTRDVDLALFAGFGGEAERIDGLLERYASRILNPKEYGLKYRIVLLTTAGGINVDVGLAALPFEERMMERARDVAVSASATLRLCSPEDLIITKVIAGRGQDGVDVRGVLVRQGKLLNFGLIEEELQDFSELLDRDLVAEFREHRRSAKV